VKDDLNLNLAKTMTQTFSPKLSANKSVVLMFFDRDAIAQISGIAQGIDCFEEWLVILAANRIVFCDINDSNSVQYDPTISIENIYNIFISCRIDAFPVKNFSDLIRARLRYCLGGIWP